MAQGTRDAWKIVFCVLRIVEYVGLREKGQKSICLLYLRWYQIGKWPDWCCCKISPPWLKSWLKSITAAVPEWEWQEWKFPLENQSHRVSCCYHCESMWAMWLDALSDYWEIPDKCVISFRSNHNRSRIKPLMIEARVVFTWKKKRNDLISSRRFYYYFVFTCYLIKNNRITNKAKRPIRTSQNWEINHRMASHHIKFYFQRIPKVPVHRIEHKCTTKHNKQSSKSKHNEITCHPCISCSTTITDHRRSARSVLVSIIQ